MRKILGRHCCRGARWPPGCWHSAVYLQRIYICTHIVSTLKPEFRATAKFNMVTVWRSPKTLFAVMLPHTRPPAIPLSKYNNPSAVPVHSSVFALIQYFLVSVWSRYRFFSFFFFLIYISIPTACVSM